MSVRIVTDSTCDLPAETINRYGIHVVPMYINVGKQGYLDGIDMKREEFYNRLPTFQDQPTTAVPSIERFRAAYNTLADEDASEVLSIHISTALSAVADVATVAAKETSSVPVTVLDSQQLSLGTGFLVETAAKMASVGRSAAEILIALNDQIQRSHVFAALDTLEFLKRSGRMNHWMSSLGSLLQIKPILTVRNGKVDQYEKERTHKRAVSRLVEIVREQSNGNQQNMVTVMHADTPEEGKALARELQTQLNLPVTPSITDVPPAIVTHGGPGILAVGFFVAN